MSEQQPNNNDDGRTIAEIWQQQMLDEPPAEDWLWNDLAWYDGSARHADNPLPSYFYSTVGEIQGSQEPMYAPPSIEGEEAVPQLHGSIPHINTVQPTQSSSDQETAPRSQTHSWIEPMPSKVPDKRSPFDPLYLDDWTTTATPPLTAVQTPAFVPGPNLPPSQNFQPVPRPYDEYQALVSGIMGGVPAYQAGERHANSEYFTPHNDVQMGLVPTMHAPDGNGVRTPQPKRKRDKEFTVPTAPAKKRMRGNDVGVAESDLLDIQYRGDDVYDHVAVYGQAMALGTPASNLIGKKRNNCKQTHSRPWGLQRIITQQFIEQRAAKLGVAVPPVTSEDVYLYCNSPNSPFNPIHSTFPPEWVDIRLLGNIEITAEELLTFFPHHLKWHDAIFRLSQNGWSPNDMAKYVNYARGLVKPDNKRGNTALKWLQAATGDILGKSKGGFRDRKPWKTTCFTAKDWVPFAHRSTFVGPIDYFLVDLSDGVVNLPQGVGARLLTRAIRLALVRGDYDIKLSQIHQYVRENLLIFPPLPSMVGQMMAGKHPDTAAIDRAKLMLHNLKK